MAKIQFILKAREVTYRKEAAPEDGKYLSSGLLNSASFVKDMLSQQGHETELSHAIDNSCIDRLVTKFKPDIVVIEAYWVVPEKFDILIRFHPKIKWVIRNHSATPFLANEGIVMDWSMRYMDYPNVILACNDARTDVEMRDVIGVYKPLWNENQLRARVSLLPNYYPASFNPMVKKISKDVIDVACFGAMRPLKNQLAQAVAAIQFAKKHKKHLRFHVNGTRVEMKGEPIVHNIQKMFALLPYELVEHNWLPHDKFCELLRTMDVSMQVSYTETFNIVTADAVVNGVPVIVSSDILWADPAFRADPNSTQSMIKALETVFKRVKKNTYWQKNLDGLRLFSENSINTWNSFIETTIKGT